MAKSRTTFQKRQKEIARMEKQREKAAKRMQRKLAKQNPETDRATDDLDLINPGQPPTGTVE